MMLRIFDKSLSKSGWWLILIALILLLQLFLRAHDPTAMPAYADESHHIRRAEIAWNVNPIEEFDMRKVLLYYYLGAFETSERPDYWLVARLATALFTLLGGAGIYALGKHLADERAGLMGLFFYAVLPFTIFIDRMALSDPFTLVFVVLGAWMSLLWVKKPSYPRAIITGLILMLAPIAKLTALGIIAAPIIALALYQAKNWRRYVRSGAIIAVIFGVVWVPLMGRVILGEIQGGDSRIVLVEDYLLNIHEEDQNFLENFFDSTWLAIQQTRIYAGPLVVWLTAGLWVFLFWRKLSATSYLSLIFILAWLPALAFGAFPRTRYLEIGMPFFALILSIGIYEFADMFKPSQRRTNIERGIVLGFVVYALAWGAPFFYQSITDPANLPLPERDRWRYVRSTTAGFGQIDAIQYLENEGAISSSSEQTEIYGILGSCHLLRLFFYEAGQLNLTCAELEAGRQLSPQTLGLIEDAAEEHDPLYLLIERDLDSNFDDLVLRWEFVRLFKRPYDETLDQTQSVNLELWQVQPTTGNRHRLPSLPRDALLE